MTGSSGIHEVDVQGALRLRLVAAPPTAIADLARRLPGSPAATPGDTDLPTLEVRFVETLPSWEPVRPIGHGGYVAAGDALGLGWEGDRDRPRSLLRFDALPPASRPDGEPVLTCERGVGRVPLLVPLVNTALLGVGILPLHASAVVLGGSGVAMAGWRKSGKTEAMLALTSAGASPLADEWTYVRPDRTIDGLPGPIRLPVEVVEQLGLPSSTTGSLAGPRAARAMARIAARAGGARTGRLGRGIGRAGDLLADRAAIDLPLARITGRDGDVAAAPLAVAVLLQPTTATRPLVRDVEPALVVARMTAAHVHHRLDLLGLYWLSRYAAPEVTHPVLDDLPGHEHAALQRALDGVPCLALDHPVPFDLAAIRDALLPALAAKGVEAAG